MWVVEFGLQLKRHFVDPDRNPADEIRFIARLFGSEYDEDTDTMMEEIDATIERHRAAGIVEDKSITTDIDNDAV